MSKRVLALCALGMWVAACSSSQKAVEPKVGGRTSNEGTVSEDVADSSGKSGAPKDGKGPEEKYAALSHALRAGKTQAVQEETARILVANPNDITALNALALWNYRQGKVGAARLLLARAIEKGEPKAAVLNNYGLMLQAEGDELAAAEQFKKALRLDESHAEANANLGAHYAKGADWKKALPRLEAAWRGGRQESSVANNLALALSGEGQTEKARKIFEDAMKRNNKDPILLLNYAALLIEKLNRPKEGLPLVYRVKFLETEKKDVITRANQLERKASATSTTPTAP